METLMASDDIVPLAWDSRNMDSVQYRIRSPCCPLAQASAFGRFSSRLTGRRIPRQMNVRRDLEAGRQPE